MVPDPNDFPNMCFQSVDCSARDVFKLVRDFSVAPYKPSDSAQKFDGPLNLASHEREVR